MGVSVYLDTILVPLSLFLTVGYHAYLWHTFTTKPSITSIGIDILRRRSWFQGVKGGDDDKKGMLAVQSMRNTLMATILTASISIMVVLLLAALVNNTYNVSELLNKNRVFGSQSSKMLALKYGSAWLFLLISFFCSAIGLGFLIDSNFLVNVSAESECDSSCSCHAQAMMERGFMLAVVGNRVLCITFTLLLWMFGPVPVLVSSVALVYGLYELDFAASLAGTTKRNLNLH